MSIFFFFNLFLLFFSLSLFFFFNFFLFIILFTLTILLYKCLHLPQ